VSETLIERDAVRILFILYFCGREHLQLSLFDSNDYTHVIDSESKLQKIDFWLRYPDHLAAALLCGCEQEGSGSLRDRSEEIKRIIRQIFEKREPVLRWIPMRKYLRGAYEPLDRVMAYVSALGLAYRRVLEWGHCTSYFLTPKGNCVVERIQSECGEAQWYTERCQLIHSFFGHLNGFEIRTLQYLQEEYKVTPNLATIDRIELEIRQRFARFYGEEL
jgi:hypothetical protein